MFLIFSLLILKCALFNILHVLLYTQCCIVQVYYHLGAFEDSVTYALGADKLFNVNASSEYVETIVGMRDTISLNFFSFSLGDLIVIIDSLWYIIVMPYVQFVCITLH